MYLAYREDGGQPTDDATRLIVHFGETLLTSGHEAARAILPDVDEVAPAFAPTLRALEAIAAGNHDLDPADDPAYESFDAVELAILLASLPPPA